MDQRSHEKDEMPLHGFLLVNYGGLMSEYDTKPTIETILERMEAYFLQTHRELQALREEVSQFREEIRKHNEAVEDRVDVFIREVLDIKRTMRRERTLTNP
jgi:hypothetical protein